MHAARPSSTKKIAEVQSLRSLAIEAVLQNLLSVAVVLNGFHIVNIYVATLGQQRFS